VSLPEVRFAVRPGRRDDALEVARLWIRSAEEHSLYDLVYAPAPDEVIGFLSGELREGSPAFKPKTWAAIEDIYVTPEHRSLGVGRALFKEGQKWAKKKGADGVSLQVAAVNVRARKFYEELGFREVSVYQVKEF
jgi:ribosomal protein S18 acetylase RimI-like enzyme